MSSVGSSFKQLASSDRFLVARVAGSTEYHGFTAASLETALAAVPTARRVGSVVNTVDASAFVDATTARTFSLGDMFVDVGKTLYIQENSMVAYVYKLVKPLANIAAEGVDGNLSFYVLVTSYDASKDSMVVRTGY